VGVGGKPGRKDGAWILAEGGISAGWTEEKITKGGGSAVLSKISAVSRKERRVERRNGGHILRKRTWCLFLTED